MDSHSKYVLEDVPELPKGRYMIEANNHNYFIMCIFSVISGFSNRY